MKKLLTLIISIFSLLSFSQGIGFSVEEQKISTNEILQEYYDLECEIDGVYQNYTFFITSKLNLLKFSNSDYSLTIKVYYLPADMEVDYNLVKVAIEKKFNRVNPHQIQDKIDWGITYPINEIAKIKYEND